MLPINVITNAPGRRAHRINRDLVERGFAVKKLSGWCLIVAVCCFGSPILSAQKTVDNPNAPEAKTKVHQMSTKDVQENLQKALDNKNPAYTGSNIQTAVDDQTITLSGTVTSSSQREMARQIAEAYAGNRKIIDRMVISQ
jgi:osmotically-inducible protein OsmY